MVTKAKKALLASLAAFLCVMLTVFGLSMSVSLSETAKAADETTTEVAEVNGVKFATLAEAVNAVSDGGEIVVYSGVYTIPNVTYTGKSFTISAGVAQTVSFDMSVAHAIHGAKVSFNNVTFDYKTNNNYIGLQHADTLTYKGCTINGMVFLYAINETFNGCTFNQTSKDAYNVWTYGAKNVAFNQCVFNSAGKSVLVYNEGANPKTDLTVSETKFVASEKVDGKAAIEIDTSLMAGGTTITIDDKTTATDFAEGSNSGSTLWNDKKQTADTNKNTTITVADEVVYAPYVAAIGEVKYFSLTAAIAAAKDGETVKLLADATEDVVVDKNITLDLGGKTLTGTNSGKPTVSIQNGATTTVKNGSVIGTSSYYTIEITKGSNATATFEDITATAGNTGSSMIDNWGTLTINSGVYSGGLNVVKSEEGSTLVINGGKFTLDYSTDGYTGVIFAYGDTTITGGEFIQSLTSHGRWNYPQVVLTGVVEGYTAITKVTGGSFINKSTSSSCQIFHGLTPATSDNFKVSGGTFSKAISAGYCAEGFIPSTKKNADGMYGVKEGKYVAKVGSKNYETLADAIRLAAEGKTVTLLDNIDGNFEISDIKKITLDLNGYTINGGKGTAKAAITNYGTLTITDSSAAKTGTIKRDDSGIEGEKSYYVIQNRGTMTIEQANVVNNSGYRKTNPSGSMVGSSLICNGGNDTKVSTLTINGGEFTQNNFIAIKNDSTAVLNINGGIINSENESAVQNWSTAQILGGTLNGVLWTLTYDETAIGKTVFGGEAVLNGRIYAEKNSQDVTVEPYVSITGGKLNVTEYKVENSEYLKVSGGTFANAVPSEYCADRFIPTQNADGTYGVKACVAKVGSTKYETLAEAIAAAKDGETVKLLADCSGNGIQIKKDTFTTKGLIVDFGGHTYTVGGVLVGSAGTGTNAFQLLQGNKITFQNGTIKGVTENTKPAEDTPDWHGAPAIVIQNYCDLTLKNMTVSGGDETVYTMSNNNGDVVIEDTTINVGKAKGYPYPAFAFDVCRYASYPSVSVTVRGNSVINGNVEISGAIGEGQNRQLNVENGTFNGTFNVSGNVPANIAISGGTFTNAVRAEYCADGFIPTQNADGTYGVKEGTYVAEVKGVKYETLQAAIDAAARNATVKLLANTRENVTIAKNITLDLNGYTINGGTVAGKATVTVTARVTIKDSSASANENGTGTIMREDTAENSGVSSHYVIDVQGGGWLMFEGGNVINHSGVVGVKGASLVRIGDDSVDKYPGLTIKGGTFTQDNFIVIKVDRGYFTLNGGTLNSANTYAIENWFRATVKNGTVNGAVSSWTYSDGSNSTLEISGGTINGDVTSVNYGNATDKKARVSVTGGTINGMLDTRSYDPATGDLTSINDATKATIGITGGTFSTDPTKYVVEDSAITENENGTFGVEKTYLAKVGETSYYTMEEAFKAQTASGEAIVLLRDYTTGSTFNSGTKHRVVDLNGHTWTYTGTNMNSAAFEINNPNATLTVKNGKIISTTLVGLIPSAMGGTITYDNSGLVFENVEMTSNGHSGIETNGNNTNDSVTLKNSTLNVPNGFGIYFPSSGTLTIDNSTITAKTMGVQVCAGSLEIQGDNTQIKVTGGPVEKTENDGAIQDGAAISIVNRPGYKGLSNIVITGGTFTAKAGKDAIKAYDWNNAEKTESAFTKADLVAVSGGTFSSKVNKDYLADRFVVNKNTDGTYGVTAGSGFAGACVVVTESLAMKVVVGTASKYVVVTYKGLDGIAKTVRFDKFTDIRIKDNDYKYCLFDQIMPQMIDVKFSFELYGENDVMLDRKANYSVVDYLAHIIASDKDSTEFRNVAASLIEYANRAKVVKGLATTVAPTFVDKDGKTVTLDYNAFVDAHKIPAKDTLGAISKGDGQVIYQAKVVFDDAYTLTFYTNDNEKQYTYKLDDKFIVFDENGEYTVNVLAQNITTKYVLTVYDKDSKLVQTVTYGVSTYCIRMQETETPQGELYVASYYYGVAVNQYGTANPNSVQG